MQQVPPPQPQQQDFMGMMKEAAVRGDQQAMEMMVYFKKKEMESAAEAEMGDEIAALRKQLEKLEFKKLAVVTTDEPTTHTGRSTSHEWWCLNSTSRALGQHRTRPIPLREPAVDSRDSQRGGHSTTAETVDSVCRLMVCEEERSHHSSAQHIRGRWQWISNRSPTW